MATEYRYFFLDLFTDKVNLEVPCYGVSFDDLLNDNGNATVSINLDREDYSNQEVIEGTIPGRTQFFIERNGSLVWGGIVWSRTYQAQAKSLSMTCQTFKTFFDRIGIVSSDMAEEAFVGADQRNIFCELIIHAQQFRSDNFGATNINLLVDDRYPFTVDSSSVLRTVTFWSYDGWSYGKALDSMAEYDDGLDWYIDVYYDDDGNFTKRIRVDNIIGQSQESTQLSFTYPGNVSNYYWPENASRAAVGVFALGSGEGAERVIVLPTEAYNQVLIDAQYPFLQQIYTNDQVSVYSTLLKQARDEQRRLNLPITVPTLEITPYEEPEFGTWSMGDYAEFFIEDSRFPEGKRIYIRIIGYKMTPSSSEETEMCSLVLDGEGEDV